MRIIVDRNIPYIHGVIEPVAQVTYLPAADITPAAVRQADALLVRTRTRCDAALLAGSHVRLVASATIGTDHIDLPWCRANGIVVSHAPGCNAPGVAQWVFAAIACWMRHRGLTATIGLRLGIIGVGHVGSIVARWADQLGFETVLNDPPLSVGCDLDHLLQRCDIITVHTPLTQDGPWPTQNLIDTRQVGLMHRTRLLLNAARGGIINEAALLHWTGDLAIDCWQGEPRLSRSTLQRALVATPHIAGYTVEGKMRGTAMVIDALNRHFGWHLGLPGIDAPAGGADNVTLAGIARSFDPTALTAQLKQCPQQFDLLRDTYLLRHEYQE